MDLEKNIYVSIDGELENQSSGKIYIYISMSLVYSISKLTLSTGNKMLLC